MATANVSAFLRRLTRGMVAETLADHSDRQLVERLLAGRDEAVFETIVRRHGAMVYRVCWRVLQQEQDTEDAFQATFLILAQQLPTVRRHASLASWLHGTAHRVALKARAQAATRRRHEQKVATEKLPADEVAWRELYAVLDAELERLPEKWRLPLVLCYLEGQTQDEAAKQLDLSRRTLRRRLEEAKAALGRRLTSRGVVWPAALSAVLLSECIAPAALAPGLIGSTVEAAAYVAAGQAGTAIVSANVTVLTERVVKAMFMTKVKIATAVLLGGAIVMAGAVAVGLPAPAAQQPQPSKTEKTTHQKGKDPGKDSGLEMQVLKGHRGLVRLAAFSPNGKILATGALVSGNGEAEDEVILWDAAARKVLHKIALKSPVTLYQLAFSPDGKTLAIGTIGEIELRDAETGALRRVLKGGHRYGTGVFSLAFSPDGKMLASGGSATDKTIRIWDLQQGKLMRTLEGHSDEVLGLAFSPDGRTLASTGGQADPTIRLWDVESGKAKLTLKVDYQPWSSIPLAFSPDGKILAKGSGAVVVFFDVQTGEVKDKLITEQTWGNILEALAFSPDGKLVAGGRTSGQIDVWETRPADGMFDWRAGDLKQTLKEASQGVMSLAFSPSGHLLASGDRNALVRIWKLKK